MFADPSNGPGSYNHEKDFGHDSKNMTIGVRRNENTDQTAGPGDYNPDYNTVKHRNPKADF